MDNAPTVTKILSCTAVSLRVTRSDSPPTDLRNPSLMNCTMVQSWHPGGKQHGTASPRKNASRTSSRADPRTPQRHLCIVTVLLLSWSSHVCQNQMQHTGWTRQETNTKYKTTQNSFNAPIKKTTSISPSQANHTRLAVHMHRKRARSRTKRTKLRRPNPPQNRSHSAASRLTKELRTKNTDELHKTQLESHLCARTSHTSAH